MTSKFVAAGDFHIGWEKRGGKKKAVHDTRAIKIFIDFIKDYKPQKVILAGDVFDFAEISHWNDIKRLTVENLRLSESVKTAYELLLSPLEIVRWAGSDKITPNFDVIYMKGNHERFIEDLVEKNPALDGFLQVNIWGPLFAWGWKVYPVGSHYDLGKLRIIHGEKTRGRRYEYNAVVDHEKSVRVFHHHSFQVSTKHNAVDAEQVKTGIAVPGMCHRSPQYGGNAPNNWMTGFLFGEVAKDGSFSDYVAVIHKKGLYWNGKKYGGPNGKSS